MGFRRVIVMGAVGLVCSGAARLLCAQEESPAQTNEGDAAAGRAVRPSRTEATPSERASAKLREMQQEIRNLRAQANRNRQAELARLKDIAAEKRALARKLEALQKDVAKREKENAEKSTQLEAAEKERKENEARAAQLAGAVARYLEAVEKRIDAGIPWSIPSRKSSLADARKSTDAENASPAAALMAAARVQQEEEALGRLVESAKVNVEVNGAERQVLAFHLGLLGIVFANEEGTVIGFTLPGQTLADGLEAATNPAAAEGYLMAVDILRRRRTPAIVELWLPRLDVRKEGE